MTPEQAHQAQNDFFKSRKTFDVSYRIAALKKLKSVLARDEQEVYNVLKADLGKCKFEAFITEYQVVIGELDTFLKKTKKWSRPVKVSSALLNFPSKATVTPEFIQNSKKADFSKKLAERDLSKPS